MTTGQNAAIHAKFTASARRRTAGFWSIFPPAGKLHRAAKSNARIDAVDRYFDQLAREETLYQEHRTAMLERGLSPEPRRLLFSAARVALAKRFPGEKFRSDLPRTVR